MDIQYIEREAVKRELLSWAVSINHPEYLIKDDALHIIDSMPAADVECCGRLRGVTYEDGKVTAVHIRDTDDVVKVFVPMASEKEATGMAEYIEKDYHYSTRYALIKNGERIEFNSEQDACEFLGVKKCSVASCFRKGYKCKGYEIERCGISTHGETKTRLHKIWESMIARCEYEKHPYYADYGGRGITVCDEWHSYIEFREWAITHGYNDDLTIDRIKNDKGYDASNCRWVTMREQQNNKRSNHIVYLGEIGHTISEWSEILGIGKTTIRMRLKSGWTDEAALTVPIRKRTRGYRPSAQCGAKNDGGDD